GSANGIPVLVNIHDVDLARRYATRIVGMSGGHIVYDGDGQGLDTATLNTIYGGESWLQYGAARSPCHGRQSWARCWSSCIRCMRPGSSISAWTASRRAWVTPPRCWDACSRRTSSNPTRSGKAWPKAWKLPCLPP